MADFIKMESKLFTNFDHSHVPLLLYGQIRLKM